MVKNRKDWLERAIGHLLLGGAIALIGIAITARLQFNHVQEAAALRNQSRSTIEAIEGVTRGLLDAETAQRGYLLTGNRQYLEPYYGGIDRARSRLDDASTRTRGDAEQETLGGQLHDLVERKLEEFTLTVALIFQHDDLAAMRIVGDQDGQRLMNQIRATGAALIDREQTLLATRTKSADAAIASTERLFWAVQALLALLFVGGYFLVRRELRARASIGAALRDSENALRKSERFIKGMADTLPALIGYVDRSETYRFANIRYASHFGPEAAPFVGKTMAEVLGPLDYEKVRREVGQALAGIHQHFDRMVTAGGREVHINVDYAPDVDVDGQVAGFYIMVTDITERKAVELAVANQEQMLRTITDNMPALICYIDRDHHFRFNNRAYERWVGRPVSEITNRHLRDVYGDEIYQLRLKPAVEDAMKGVRTNFEVTFSGYDGKLHHTRGKYVPHHDESGQVIGVYGLIVDETRLKVAQSELQASQRFVERVGEVAGVGGWQLDLKTNEVAWSDETCRIHDVPNGYRPTLEEAIAFYAPEARPLIADAVERGIAIGEPWDLELPLTSARGRPFWARSVGEVEYENERPVRLIGAFQDITRRKQAEQALSDSREMLQVTLESIGDAVITTDNEGMILWLNPVAERLTGWLKAEAVGQALLRVFVVLDDESREPVDDPVRLCLEKGKVTGVADRAVLVSRNGAEYGIEDSTSPIRDTAGNSHGVVLVFHDVTEQRRLSKEMSHRATHDPLTGLANRSEFETRLNRVLAGADADSSNSLLYIDLDQFKLVNDACGHSVGDQLLRQVSSLLTHCVRGRDTVARLGGDEFGVILERCTAEQGLKVAQKICEEMEEFRFLHDGRRFRVGASIGLVPVDHRWMNLAAVMQAADASCYAAKEAGRNRVHAWFDTDAAVRTRQGEMQWVTRLEQALDEDRFELYGQRIERITGPDEGLHCEVLLRLRENDGSIILPGVFLPAAERFNLASRIDRWVLRRMFEWLEEASRRDRPIDMIAINLSGHSVGDRTFHRDVREMIRHAGFDVGCLCFEITETAAITNFSEAKSFIDEVRALGVKIALDDFGAGASSFGYLKSLPVDYLKIDGQFIRDLLRDALDNAAVRCFREVAGIVGVRTIAECVETEEVRGALAGIGIDFVQGYLIHRPEPLERAVAGPAAIVFADG